MIIRSIVFDLDSLVRCKAEGLYAELCPGTVESGGNLGEWDLLFRLEDDEESEWSWAEFDPPVSLRDFLFDAEMLKVFEAFLASDFTRNPSARLDAAFKEMFDQVYSEARVEIKGWEQEGEEKKIRVLVSFQRPGNAPRTLSFLVGQTRKERIFEPL